MRPYIAIAVALVIGFLIYGIDRGLYVGSYREVWGAEALPYDDVIQRRCRHLFITGISEFNAFDGAVSAPNAMRDRAAAAIGFAKPDNGFCPIFARFTP